MSVTIGLIMGLTLGVFCSFMLFVIVDERFKRRKEQFDIALEQIENKVDEIETLEWHAKNENENIITLESNADLVRAVNEFNHDQIKSSAIGLEEPYKIEKTLVKNNKFLVKIKSSNNDDKLDSR